jgi:hypothetical protein
MNEPRRDLLDGAIDATAARMTAVAADDSLGQRIISELPERTTWLGWVSASWALRLAVGVLAIGMTVVVLRTFDDGSTAVLRTESATAPITIVEPPSNDRRTSVEPPLIVRRTIVEPSSNRRRTTVEGERSDHEFSLAAIAAPEALSVGSLSPDDLPAEDALAIAPLAIADLPLTPESFAPR